MDFSSLSLGLGNLSAPPGTSGMPCPPASFPGSPPLIRLLVPCLNAYLSSYTDTWLQSPCHDIPILPRPALVPLTAAQFPRSLPLLRTKFLKTDPCGLFGAEEKLVDCPGEGLCDC